MSESPEVIHIFDVDSTWRKLSSGYADYVNNGNIDIYLQRVKPGQTLDADSEGVRIRPGGCFITHPGEDTDTYLKTLAGTSIIARYKDLNCGAGTSVIIDPVTGQAATVNNDGQLHVVLRGAVDDNNSSSTPLAAGEVFTGEASDILDFSIVFISVYSDVGSAVDGLSLQQSCDGVHFDHTDEYTIDAGKGKTFSVQPACKYFRVVYANGASD